MSGKGAELPVVAAAELPAGLTEDDVTTARRTYVRPLSVAGCGAARQSDLFEVLVRMPEQVVATRIPRDRLLAWASGVGEGAEAWMTGHLACLDRPPAAFAGLSLAKPCVMGIVNVTPDSFSDGGETPDTESAAARGLAMREAGAQILDIGGESTRPGADPVAPDVEAERVVPVVRALAQAGAVVSVDSRRAGVMAAALEAGAAIVNDVTALSGDADSLGVVASQRVPVILMHMLGEPQTMQADPRYDCALLDVFDYLEDRVAACVAAGIPRERIAVDPGIGFGKTSWHNLQILGRLSLFKGLGCPIVLGVSRKSFIGRLSRGEPAQRRLPGSLAAALAGLDQGADIVRVHDVAETCQAMALWAAIRDGRGAG